MTALHEYQANNRIASGVIGTQWVGEEGGSRANTHLNKEFQDQQELKSADNE